MTESHREYSKSIYASRKAETERKHRFDLLTHGASCSGAVGDGRRGSKSRDLSSIRILIYGAGVIGSLYAALFAEAGFSVTVYARGARLETLQSRGLFWRDNRRHGMSSLRSREAALRNYAASLCGGIKKETHNHSSDRNFSKIYEMIAEEYKKREERQRKGKKIVRYRSPHIRQFRIRDLAACTVSLARMQCGRRRYGRGEEYGNEGIFGQRANQGCRNAGSSHTSRRKRSTIIRKADVKVIERLEREDRYHFIFVTVRTDQAADALSELRENISPNIVTMINTLTDYAEWEKLCGKGRILPAFPGAGGGIRHGVLDAALAPRLIQPTTFGEISGKKTKRVRALARIFQISGIPYQIVRDMHSWQLSHLGLVVPLGDAYDRSSVPDEMWKEKELMRETADQIRKNFDWLAERGMLSPAKFELVRRCPGTLMTWVMCLLLRSDFGDMFVFCHARKAMGEMRMLSTQLYTYMEQS